MSQQHNAAAPDPNSGRIPLPELILPDEPASFTAAHPLPLDYSEGTHNDVPFEMQPGADFSEAPGSQVMVTHNVDPSTQRLPSPRQSSRAEITRLNASQVRDLTPMAAAAAHQDRGLAVRQAANRLRSASINRDSRVVRDYQFRPSQQQRGLNLFALEPGGPMERALQLAQRIAASIPKSDPPRPGQRDIDAQLTQRLVEASKGSMDWRQIRFQMQAIESFNTLYHGQCMKYESEVYPTAHTAIPEMVRLRMRAGHVALAYLVAEVNRLLALRSQLRVQKSIGWDAESVIQASEDYDAGIKSLFKKLEVSPEPGAILHDRLD